jgi:hypothetical protein
MRVKLEDLYVPELRWYYRTLGGIDEMWDRERLLEAIREKRRT